MLYTNLEDLVHQKRTESLTRREQSLDATRNSVSQEEEQILAEIARELKQEAAEAQPSPIGEPKQQQVNKPKKTAATRKVIEKQAKVEKGQLPSLGQQRAEKLYNLASAQK